MKNQIKRVLVYGMSHNPGGIETYLINTAKRLEGKVVFDYICDFPDIAHKDVISEMKSRVFFIPPKGKKLFSHLKSFYEVLKKHPEYDTIYFNILDAGAAITQLVPFVMGKKIVTHSHNSSTDKLYLHRLLKPLLNMFTKEKVACSGLAASYMFKNGENTLIIPNAIDTEKFVFNPNIRNKKREELGLKAVPVICHIGRLSNQKNPFRMLDIFKKLLEKNKDAVLISVGTGELEKEVHSYARNIGVEKSVMFLGKRSDIPEILMASDVFFLPSLYEGLPIVGIEAQSSGLPCVFSDSITTEIALCENVKFLSLKKSDDIWADTLINFASIPKTDTKSKIIAAGYDINNCSEKDELLCSILT